MKRHQDIQRILEDCKGVKNIPGIKSGKRRVLMTKMKNERGEVITSRKGMPMSLVNSTKKNYSTTMNKKKLNKKSVRTKMRAASTYTAVTPV